MLAVFFLQAKDGNGVAGGLFGGNWSQAVGPPDFYCYFSGQIKKDDFLKKKNVLLYQQDLIINKLLLERLELHSKLIAKMFFFSYTVIKTRVNCIYIYCTKYAYAR